MQSVSEKTIDTKHDLLWMWFAITGLAVWLLYDLAMMVQGKNKFADLIFIALFAGLVIWRFAFQYEYVIENNQFMAARKLLSFEQSLVIPLEQVESFSDKYKRNLVIRQRVSGFYHWYSSGDTQPVRSITYMQGKKRYVLIFKCSDTLMDKIISTMPDRFVPSC